MGVEFQEENAPVTSRARAPQGITQFLIAKGIAQNEAQANNILLLVLVLALCGAGFFFMVGSPPELKSPPLPEPITALSAVYLS